MMVAGCPAAPGEEHRVGRQLLEQMYLQQTGMAMPPILTAALGKPYFAEGPWHFSITHTRGQVFCALAQQPVGIDAERLDRQISPTLAEKILSPSELMQYREAEDPQRALLTFWVLKEAEAKASGKGLRIYPNHTAFHLDDPRVTERDGCLLAVVTGSEILM